MNAAARELRWRTTEFSLATGNCVQAQPAQADQRPGRRMIGCDIATPSARVIGPGAFHLLCNQIPSVVLVALKTVVPFYDSTSDCLRMGFARTSRASGHQEETRRKPPATRESACGGGGLRAYENEVFLAMANWAGLKFQGHSMIIGYDGKTIEIGDEDEQILFAALDMTALRKHRKSGIYGRHHRQPSAYGPLIES